MFPRNIRWIPFFNKLNFFRDSLYSHRRKIAVKLVFRQSFEKSLAENVVQSREASAVFLSGQLMLETSVDVRVARRHGKICLSLKAISLPPWKSWTRPWIYWESSPVSRERPWHAAEKNADSLRRVGELRRRRTAVLYGVPWRGSSARNGLPFKKMFGHLTRFIRNITSRSGGP